MRERELKRLLAETERDASLAANKLSSTFLFSTNQITYTICEWIECTLIMDRVYTNNG